jgi:hypothetical protein
MAQMPMEDVAFNMYIQQLRSNSPGGVVPVQTRMPAEDFEFSIFLQQLHSHFIAGFIDASLFGPSAYASEVRRSASTSCPAGPAQERRANGCFKRCQQWLPVLSSCPMIHTPPRNRHVCVLFEPDLYSCRKATLLSS